MHFSEVKHQDTHRNITEIMWSLIVSLYDGIFFAVLLYQKNKRTNNFVSTLNTFTF